MVVIQKPNTSEFDLTSLISLKVEKLYEIADNQA